MVQDDDIWQFQDDAYLVIEYWRSRCLAAEKFIEESPCDPDTYPSQIKAYDVWQKIRTTKIL